MSGAAHERKLLFDRWMAAHAPDNSAVLFRVTPPEFILSDAATALLQRAQSSGRMCLYIACLGDPAITAIPFYIGKSVTPYQRWSSGHLGRLRKAARSTLSGSYARWLPLLASTTTPPHILCVDESQIQFAPIPQFPTLVGSVEYQLVALADDAYRGYLMNSEGTAR